MKAFVLATGPSLTQQQVDAVRGKGVVFAVSDAYRLAPWADVLVSTDAAWWFNRPEARQFKGRRFSAVDASHLGCERVPDIPSGMNSGLVATRLAVLMGATIVVLLGLDMNGTHFFGPHQAPLANTTELQFEAMREQFAQYRPDSVQIVNCTPGSALTCYPVAPLEAMV